MCICQKSRGLRLLAIKCSPVWLREGARNWYDRPCVGLGFSPAPGDPAAYSYDRDGARGSLAIHVDVALTAGNTEFYDRVKVPLLSQFFISKIEKKFLGMRLTQSDDFSVSITKDTKSIKELPVGVDSFSEEEKKSLLKSLVGQLLYLDLTRPDLALMISDLSHSSSKTSDERLRVVKALLKRVREPAKSIIYTETNSSPLDLVCYVDASYNQATESGIRFNDRGSMFGLMCNRGKFSPVQWKTAEIKRRCTSVKSANYLHQIMGHNSFVI